MSGPASIPALGGHAEPVGIQLRDGSQQVVPAAHRAVAQNEALPSLLMFASIDALPSAPPSLPPGVIDDPHAAAKADKQSVSPIEVSERFFIPKSVPHERGIPTSSGGGTFRSAAFVPESRPSP